MKAAREPAGRMEASGGDATWCGSSAPDLQRAEPCEDVGDERALGGGEEHEQHLKPALQVYVRSDAVGEGNRFRDSYYSLFIAFDVLAMAGRAQTHSLSHIGLAVVDALREEGSAGRGVQASVLSRPQQSALHEA